MYLDTGEPVTLERVYRTYNMFTGDKSTEWELYHRTDLPGYLLCSYTYRTNEWTNNSDPQPVTKSMAAKLDLARSEFILRKRIKDIFYLRYVRVFLIRSFGYVGNDMFKHLMSVVI